MLLDFKHKNEQMKKYKYQTEGTCSQEIFFEVDDQRCIHNVRFEGGCSGNLQGIGRLVEGMNIEEVESKLSGIRCGAKQTSCPDQLAYAIHQVINK
jgi:uncharacterized protein (TIGR03905 family)